MHNLNMPKKRLIKEKMCEHYDWPNTRFLPKGGETPGTWIPQLEQEIGKAIECGVSGIREDPGFFRQRFPHERVFILFDNYNAFAWAQGKGPYTLTPQLHDLYVRLFDLGKRWQSPIYVCSASAARWNVHPSIDGIGESCVRWPAPMVG